MKKMLAAAVMLIAATGYSTRTQTTIRQYRAEGKSEQGNFWQLKSYAICTEPRFMRWIYDAKGDRDCSRPPVELHLNRGFLIPADETEYAATTRSIERFPGGGSIARITSHKTTVVPNRTAEGQAMVDRQRFSEMEYFSAEFISTGKLPEPNHPVGNDTPAGQRIIQDFKTLDNLFSKEGTRQIVVSGNPIGQYPLK